MTGLDTNVLVRYLVEDDPAQAARSRHFLAKSKSKGETLYISGVVLCELVWALRSVYNKPKSEILRALNWILEADLFVVEGEGLVRAAVQTYEAGPGDFADYLLGQIHQARGCRHTVTFDRDLRHTPGFSLL